MTTIVDCPNSKYADALVDDVDAIPFRSLGDTLGPLSNANYPPSNETNLLRRLVIENGPHKSMIHTFNYWLEHKLYDKITSTTYKVGNSNISFTNVKVMKPCRLVKKELEQITPRIARDKHFSYASKVFIDVNVNNGGKVSTRENVEIGEIPIMLGSVACHLFGITDTNKIQYGECPNDTLAYFINKGAEKIIRVRDRLRYDMFVTYHQDENMPYHTRITCNSIFGIGTSLVTNYYRVATMIYEIRLQDFEYDKGINVLTMFNFIGVNTDDALDMIIMHMNIDEEDVDAINRATLLLTSSVFENDFANNNIYDIIRSIRDEKVRSKTDKEIYDDVMINLFSFTDNLWEKQQLLAHMTSRTILFQLGLVGEDPLDSWSNKKFQVPSDAIEQHFNTQWTKTTRTMKEDLNNEIGKYGGKVSVDDVANKFNPLNFRSKMMDFFSSSTNSFSSKGSKNDVPLSEQYKHITPIDGTSLITKTNTPTVVRNQKFSIRTIHPSQAGYICPAETPESEGIGLIKNISITCMITSSMSVSRDQMTNYLLPLNVSNKHDINKYGLIFNGIFKGWIEKHHYQTLKDMKKNDIIPYWSCVMYNRQYNMIEVYTVDSRPVRPLLIVDEHGQLVIDKKGMWNANTKALIREGCLDYIDAKEQEYLTLAMSTDDVRYNVKNIKYTHSEIQGNAVFGFCGSIIPWANKNKGPRVIYQSGMTKQALNNYNTVYYTRFDTSFKRLLYAQRPICESNVLHTLGLETMPSSQNVIVAMLAMPDNNEDALVVKKEMLEGMYFRIGKYVSHKMTIQMAASTMEIFAKPTEDSRGLSSKYSTIGDDGFPAIGTRIYKNNCIIGKLKSPTTHGIVKNATTGKYETANGSDPINLSKCANADDEGFVNRVLVTTDSEGIGMCKVNIYKYRRYQEGDKYASRYSQKGTVGSVLPKAKLPRIYGGPNDGVTPDIFFSPASIPTRMTVSKLEEGLASKAALYTNAVVDCTTLEESHVEDHINTLYDVGVDHGLEGDDLKDFSYTLEKMARPNGKLMENKVSVVIIAYQALRHHVLDKFQIRRTGQVNILTRQGAGGRSRGMSLRFGELESTAMVSNGNAYTLQERLMKVSDEFKNVICVECGQNAIVNIELNTTRCPMSPNHKKFGILEVPYISNVLRNYLLAAGVNISLIPKARLE